MKQAILDLLTSKKGLVYVTSALVVVGNMFAGLVGYEVDKTLLAEYLGITASWLVGQGLTDHGATAAKVNAASVAAMDATGAKL